jgi:CheY-specific phosphatase CheX
MGEPILQQNIENASEIFREEVRRQAAQLLQGFAAVDKTEISDNPGDPAVYGRWMSIIILAGKAVKMNFRVHFNEEVAKQLALKIYAKKADDISTAQAVDFVKEFCNLVAGGVKRTMQDHQMQSLISMPLITRGSDEVFFEMAPSVSEDQKPKLTRTTESGRHQDRWKITTERGEILCSMNFDILEPEAIQSLKNSTGNPQGDDVDFL